jgi:hypothetical protein
MGSTLAEILMSYPGIQRELISITLYDYIVTYIILDELSSIKDINQ